MPIGPEPSFILELERWRLWLRLCRDREIPKRINA
jgi:hypothetical protein